MAKMKMNTKRDSDESKEIGVPEGAPPHVKAADKKLDRIHGKPEGHPTDKMQDKVVMDVHKKSFAMGKKSKGMKGITEY